MYDAKNRSEKTVADAEAAMGKEVTLPLTGKLVDHGISPNGVYVKFEVDERWGFSPGQVFVMDLDAFEIDE